MPTLRDKMTADLLLRGMSDSTSHQYLCCVRVYARHHNSSPDLLGTQDVRAGLPTSVVPSIGLAAARPSTAAPKR